MAMKFLSGFVRRDVVTIPELARFFMEQTLSPQPGIRTSAEQYEPFSQYITLIIKVLSQGNHEGRRSHEDTSIRQNR